MWSSGGSAGIHSDPDGSVRRIFESCRHRKCTGELSVDLTLGRPCPDRTPTNQISSELGRDCVKELASGRKSHFGYVEEECSRESESFVDLEGTVHFWIVDETLPADGRAGFLEVDTHDDVEVVFCLLSVCVEVVCVFEGGFNVVD